MPESDQHSPAGSPNREDAYLRRRWILQAAIQAGGPVSWAHVKGLPVYEGKTSRDFQRDARKVALDLNKYATEFSELSLPIIPGYFAEYTNGELNLVYGQREFSKLLIDAGQEFSAYADAVVDATFSDGEPLIPRTIRGALYIGYGRTAFLIARSILARSEEFSIRTVFSSSLEVQWLFYMYGATKFREGPAPRITGPGYLIGGQYGEILEESTPDEITVAIVSFSSYHNTKGHFLSDHSEAVKCKNEALSKCTYRAIVCGTKDKVTKSTPAQTHDPIKLPEDMQQYSNDGKLIILTDEPFPAGEVRKLPDDKDETVYFDLKTNSVTPTSDLRTKLKTSLG